MKCALAIAGMFLLLPSAQGADAAPEARRPASDAELRFWLQNMVWGHRYSLPEMTAATGLPPAELEAALRRFDIRPKNRPVEPAATPLRVLPYPGGRHPRVGFLEGAIHPQREAKVSVFTPWDDASYVVVDVPEAIWSNLGLTYLAHTHVPTIWSKQGLELERLEWQRPADGTLTLERKLPNGIGYTAKVQPGRDAVRFELTLTNGTSERLTDLRVQNCVMLKSARGFEQQTNDNKVVSAPYVACRSPQGDRWIITAWEPCQRGWTNPPCPCLHSDPQFPDCAPGATQRVKGMLWFYQGKDLQAELRRVEATNWRK